MPTKQELDMLCALPLDVKIAKSQQRIREWIDYWGEDGVYVSFSGGKDSTALLHLVREVNPNIKAVFFNTGLELPQIQRFVRETENVDIIQVGARNMQNFELLKELGKTDKPILLKRGLAATMEELLMSAEYIMAGGNSKVMLCERGIRTFEHYTRNTMDISAIALLKEKTHLPIIADPSHAAGMARMVRPLALAAVAAGADGLMIEVHNDPAHALCDGPQALRPEEFAKVVKEANAIREIMLSPSFSGSGG